MEEQDETAKTEALSNQLIFAKILESLDLQALKCARLVSQSWCQESSPILIRKSCLRLRQYEGEDMYHMAEFMKTSRSARESFLDTVHLVQYRDFAHIVPLYAEFVDKVGPWIRVLKLTDPFFRTFTNFTDLIYHKLTSLEKFSCSVRNDFSVKHNMRIIPDTIPDSDTERLPPLPNLPLTSFQLYLARGAIFPINLKEFFTTFSKLKEFGLYVESNEPEIIQQMTGYMALVRDECPDILKLEKLSLVFSPSIIMTEEVTKSRFELLRLMNLPLKELEITVEDTKEVGLLLKHYKNTLRVVKLRTTNTIRRDNCFSSPFSTILPHVEELDLEEGLFQNFDFLKFFPACKTLRLCAGSQVLDTWASNATTLTPRPRVSSLKIDGVVVPLVFGTVQAIVDTFPALMKLSMALTDVTLRVVFAGLPGLRELTVLENFISDEGLTGINGVNGIPLEQRNVDVETDRIHPYIGDLKRLRKFELSNLPFEDITDFSIEYGLLDLVELKHVSMPRTFMTMETVGILKQNTPCLSVDIPCSAIGVHQRRHNLVPFHTIQALEGDRKLVVGSCLTIYGYVRHRASRFVVNLNIDIGMNRAFHFTQRWDQEKAIFNSKFDERWGEMENFVYNELRTGVNVCVRITCQTESFLIEVNDYTPIVYRYRTPLDTINFVEVYGGIVVHNIYFQ